MANQGGATPGWDDILRDENFQALKEDEKDKIKVDYFRRVLRPHIPPEKQIEAFDRFVDYLPGHSRRPTIRDRIGSASSVVAGIPAEVVEGAAAISDFVSEPIGGGGLRPMAERVTKPVRDYQRHIAPRADVRRDHLMDVTDATASLGTFVTGAGAASSAVRGLTRALPKAGARATPGQVMSPATAGQRADEVSRVAGGAIMAMSMGANEAVQRAMNQGMEYEDALAYVPGGAAAGGIEVGTLGPLFRHIPKPEMARSLKYLGYRMLETGVTEFTLEGTGTLLQNALERTYNLDRELLDGVVKDGATAGTAAGLLQIAMFPFLPVRAKGLSRRQRRELEGIREQIAAAEGESIRNTGTPIRPPVELVEVNPESGEVISPTGEVFSSVAEWEASWNEAPIEARQAFIEAWQEKTGGNWAESVLFAEPDGDIETDVADTSREAFLLAELDKAGSPEARQIITEQLNAEQARQSVDKFEAARQQEAEDGRRQLEEAAARAEAAGMSDVAEALRARISELGLPPEALDTAPAQPAGRSVLPARQPAPPDDGDGPPPAAPPAAPQEVEAPAEGVDSAAAEMGEPIQARDAPDAEDVAVTPNGAEVPVRYAVVEASDLVPSQMDDGRVNPSYPQALQPRDRTRAASALQVQNIAQSLNPRLLDRSPRAGDGAPIISADGVVESGNGRVLAIRRAYGQGMESAQAYRDYLAQAGYPVEGIQNPVLVRVRSGEMTQAQREAFTREANVRDTAKMSATEQAMSDAQAMPDRIMELYEGGDVDSAGNRGFVRRFIDSVVAETDRGDMVKADGSLSTDGARRIQNALLAKAYGDADVVREMTESLDSNVKSIGGALIDMSGRWARMRDMSADGQISPDADQTAALIEAMRIVQTARREGRSVGEMLGQRDILSGDSVNPLTEGFLRMFFRDDNRWTRAAGRKRISDALGHYIDYSEGTSPGTDLLGDPAPTAAQIFEAARRRHEQEQGTATGDGSDGVLAGTDGAGVEAGQPGAEAEGSGSQSRSEVREEQVDLPGLPPAEGQPARQAESRRENVPSPDDFVLTGSDRSADVAAAQGQRSLFVDYVESARDNKTPRPIYATKTKVVEARSVDLGRDTVTSPQELAEATAVLSDSAHERLFAVVTDADGKILGVVGDFKGDRSAAATPLNPMVGEALGIPGAARIWLSHNHPSGLSRLSDADVKTMRQFAINMDGTGIEVAGIMALGHESGDVTWQFRGPTGDVLSGSASRQEVSTPTPVMGRVYTDRGLLGDAQFTNFNNSVQAVMSIAGDTPGILYLDAQQRAVAFVPWTESAEVLRDSGRLARLYESAALSNASAAFIANPNGAFTEAAAANLATALEKGAMDVRVFDVISYRTDGTERAQSAQMSQPGWGLTLDRPFYSRTGATETASTVDGITSVLTRNGIDSDLVTVVQKASDIASWASPDASGMVLDGQVFLVADNIAPGDAMAVLLHEVSHLNEANINTAYGRMYDKLVSRLDRIRTNGSAAERAMAIEADRRAQAEMAMRKADGLPVTDAILNSERMAHFVQLAEAKKGSPMVMARKLVSDIVAAVRQMILSIQGIPQSLRTALESSMTSADYVRLVRTSIGEGQKIPTRAQASQGEAAPAFSRDQTLSAAFKRWFGDSKVVDAEGKPLVVYHGTNQPIESFDESRLGKNTSAASSIAFFFTENPSEAGEYAMLSGRTQVADAVNAEKQIAAIRKKFEQAERRGDWDAAERLMGEWERVELGAINADPSGHNTVPVYLNIQNPMVLDMKDSFDGHRVAEAIRTAKLEGYDGMKLENVYDPVDLRREGQFSTTQWVAFRPNQIKSAIGNVGTFDPANPDIRYSHSSPQAGAVQSAIRGAISALRGSVRATRLVTAIRNAGVTDADAAWSGVGAWLGQRAAGKAVAKAEADAFIAANSITMQVTAPTTARAGDLGVNGLPLGGTAYRSVQMTDAAGRSGDVLINTREVGGKQVTFVGSIVGDIDAAAAIRQVYRLAAESGSSAVAWADGVLPDGGKSDVRAFVKQWGGVAGTTQIGDATFDSATITGEATQSLAEATPAVNLPAYSDSPDSALGLSARPGGDKRFREQKYKHLEFVRVTWPDGQILVDAVRGLNQAHAMERARRNWPDSQVDALSRDDAMAEDGQFVLDTEADMQALAQRDVRYSRTPPDAVLEEAKRKAGLGSPAKKRLVDKLLDGYDRFLGVVQNDFLEGVADKFLPTLRLEKKHGISARDGGYALQRLSGNSNVTVYSALALGGIEMGKDGIIREKKGVPSLLGALDTVAGDIDNFLGWMVGKRAEWLNSEAGGRRENNLSVPEIAALVRLGEGKEALYADAAAKLHQFHVSLLNVAQRGGLLSAQQVSLFSKDEFYIPFMRVDENDADAATSAFTRRGLSHQDGGFKRLKGGTLALNDPLENMMANVARIIDASMKNRALYQTAVNLPNYLTRADEGNRQNAARVMHNGKPFWFNVSDEGLRRSLTGVNDVYGTEVWRTVGRRFRSVLTTTVTAEPAFILRNFIRDSMHAWVIDKHGYKLATDSLKGARDSLTAVFGDEMDPNVRILMFGGASFMGGHIYGITPEQRAVAMRKALRAKGLDKEQTSAYMKSLTPITGAWKKWREIGDAVENANRVAVYNASMAAGKAQKESIYEALDLMDYNLRGASNALSVFTDTVPFLNARIQGLYKLHREARRDPKILFGVIARQVARRGAQLALASIALEWWNDEDERYQALPDWDKDANWHIFGPKDEKGEGIHMRIPKPFEVGVIFGTIPARIMRSITGRDTMSVSAKSAARSIVDTLAFNPIPQAFRPLAEAAMNFDSFRWRNIESTVEQNRLRPHRHNVYTSPTMVKLGEMTNMSPKKLEHIYRGYLGTIGGYILGAADAVVSDKERPDWRISDYPVIGSFVRTGPGRSTQYMEDLYDLLKEAERIQRSANFVGPEESRALQSAHAVELGTRRGLANASRQASDIRKAMQEVYQHPTLTGAQKREMIDEYQRMLNALSRDTVTRVRQVRG